jgi:hypothetical protein
VRRVNGAFWRKRVNNFYYELQLLFEQPLFSLLLLLLLNNQQQQQQPLFSILHTHAHAHNNNNNESIYSWLN